MVGKKGVSPERGCKRIRSGLGNQLHHLTALALPDARTLVGWPWSRHWFQGQLKWEAVLGNRRIRIPDRELLGILWEAADMRGKLPKMLDAAEIQRRNYQ